jgi:ComF family protein
LNLLSKNSNNITDFVKLVRISFSDFLAPRHCVVCNKYTSHWQRFSKFICDKCYDNIPFADDGKLILNRFHSNFAGRAYISEAAALFNVMGDSPYIEIIHALKYQKFQSVAGEFTQLLAKRLEVENMLKYDYIVPIPIHIAKKRERGFNQSDLIADSLSELTGIKTNKNILYRHKYTVTQTLLSKSERMENMENVFNSKNESDIQNKSILLVDDVLTTGSTINSAADILIKAGAQRVGSATLAIAN